VAHTRMAQQSGAEVRLGEDVTTWHAPRGPGDVTVVTNRGTYTAGKVIFAAGAWMAHLVPELQVAPHHFPNTEVAHEVC
jgi:sarcosine oxidase